MESKNEQSLYERLGSARGIEKLVDDIVEGHMTNPAINSRFLPIKGNPAHFSEVRQHLIDFLAAGSGGPEKYKGKDMTSAHRGMNISPGEYLHVIHDIMKAMDKHKLDEQIKKDVLFIAYSLKETMVGL